jgi:hypothetical protein
MWVQPDSGRTRRGRPAASSADDSCRGPACLAIGNHHGEAALGNLPSSQKKLFLNRTIRWAAARP